MTNRRAGWLVALLFLAFCLNNADRQVVFSIFPLLRRELGFSDTQLGLTSSMFLWVYAICSPAAGLIADRVSKRTLVAASVALWSAATFLTGLSPSPVFLLLCRSLIGVTEALFYPAAAALIGDAHGPRTLSRAMSFLNSGSVVGFASGGWFGGIVAERLHWRWAFYSLGAAGLLYALPLARFLKNAPETSAVPSPSMRGVLGFFRTPTYLMLCVVYAIFAFSGYVFYTWLSYFLTEMFSLGLADAGFTGTAYLNGGSVAGLIAGGWAADRFFRYTRASRLWVVVSALALAAPAIYLTGSARSLFWTIVAATVFGFCIGLFISNMFASAFEVVPADRKASATGFLNLIGCFFSGFAGLLGGLLKKTIGLEGLMAACAVGCFAASLLLAGTIRHAFEKDYQRSRP